MCPWEVNLPGPIARLPKDLLDRPIPWFVQQDPLDFRVIRPMGAARAHVAKLCWVCGEPRYEKRLCFAVGPMCVVNRVSSEPPCHPECARFAVRACPFLSNPRMRRNEKDMPEHKKPPGIMLERNPGVTALVFPETYSLISVGDGVLFRMERIRRVEWWACGREASRAEVTLSIEAGMPALVALAKEDGPDAEAELWCAVAEATRFLPRDRAA